MLKFLSLLFFLILPIESYGAFQVPKLQAPVNDYAHMIEGNALSFLNLELQNLLQSGGSQIAVLTVDNLGGLTIEQASIEVADKWKLGTKDRDNGVLLMVAKKERSIRIEVGQGLEGDLPDAYAKRIIDETILPYFKEGQFSDGILQGVAEIVQKTDPKYKFGIPASGLSKNRSKSSNSLFEIIFFLILICFTFFWRIISLVAFGRRGRRGSGFWYLGGGGGSGGGWGGGGGGFGGGGGGGGFSGGGASGRW